METITGQNFDAGMIAWNEYQAAPWGKLRYRVARANLDKHLPTLPASILDLGGGNGFDAVPLAKDGFACTVVDFSTEMLVQGQKLATAEGVASRMLFREGSAEKLTDLFPSPGFDVVLCHNVLQYVVEPTAVLAAIHHTLKPNGILSLMITNPFTETFGFALREYDCQSALEYIDKPTKYVESFDATIQRYTESDLIGMLTATGFTVQAQYGVRCVCDFMADNERKFDPVFYEELEALEMALRDKRPYISLARFYHFIVKTDALVKQTP